MIDCTYTPFKTHAKYLFRNGTLYNARIRKGSPIEFKQQLHLELHKLSTIYPNNQRHMWNDKTLKQ